MAKIVSTLHNMRFENVYGIRLNICSECGAVIYKNKWRLGGYESIEEPPCTIDMTIKFKDWQSRASEIKGD